MKSNEQEKQIVEQTRDVLTKHFSKLKIDTANSVEEAMKHFETPVDILISEVHMPNASDGMNFLHHVHGKYDTSILIVTGYENDREFSLTHDNVFRLQKPYNCSDLLVMLKRIITTQTVINTLAKLNNTMDSAYVHVKTAQLLLRGK